MLVQCQLYDVALGLGGHLLKACEKFIVDPDMKKRFLLKFLFVFDLAVSQTSQLSDLGGADCQQFDADMGVKGEKDRLKLDVKQIEAVI